SGAPGAMMTATASMPSTVIWPGVFELMTVLVVLFGLAQPGETTYQSGSVAASSGLSIPSVLHGSRPTAGRVQFPAAMPSCAGLPTFPAASGQGSEPGSFWPAVAVWV